MSRIGGGVIRSLHNALSEMKYIHSYLLNRILTHPMSVGISSDSIYHVLWALIEATVKCKCI